MTRESFSDAVNSAVDKQFADRQVNFGVPQSDYDATQNAGELNRMFSPYGLQRADRDGNGYMDRHELEQMSDMPSIPNFMRPAIRSLSTHADDLAALHHPYGPDRTKGASVADLKRLTNQTDHLLFAESMTPDTFKKIDTDNSSLISKEEIDAFRKAGTTPEERSLSRYLTDNFSSISKANRSEPRNGISLTDVENYRANLEKDPVFKLLRSVVADLKNGVPAPESMIASKELAMAVQSNFAKIDKNADKVLGKDEVDQLDPTSLSENEPRSRMMADLIKKHFAGLAALSDGDKTIGSADLLQLGRVADGSAPPYFKVNSSWSSYQQHRLQYNAMAHDINGLSAVDSAHEVKFKEPSEPWRRLTPQEQWEWLKISLAIDAVFFWGARGYRAFRGR